MGFNTFFCKSTLFCALATALYACGGKHVSTPVKDTTTNKPAALTDPMDNLADSLADNATLYLTIADTGKDYFELRKTMFLLHKKLRIPIDTMNRYYNARKNEIELSENDSDEIYRGEYFPRRFPTENLSLEYYKAYDGHSTTKNIAIVAGIYETQGRADSALDFLSLDAPHAFTLKANVYVGYTH